ncbi:hypothetical protein FQA39_LY06607 [Lamprigera yunnana]|nr:hypothetical protein FQA39_LY06607 [Lamprigera yunnana]
MDYDLNRSLRLLEDSISTKGKFLLTTSKSKDKSRSVIGEDSFSQAEKNDSEMMDINYTIYDKTFSSLVDDNKLLTGSVLRVNEPWKVTVNTLFVEFYEILQSCINSNDIFDVVTDLARCCTDALQVIKSLKLKSSVQHTEEDVWLENERNTWRLLFVMYQDRMISSNNDDEEMSYGTSEKLCIANLFKTDSLVRETQVVIDWLEYSAAEKDNEALHFSDFSFGWENTIHQILSAQSIVFESTKSTVTNLHPDAKIREEKPLHDLDMEDEKRLCRQVFQLIRCGKLDKAQELCINCGHAWRAALYEGWRLWHNPNIIANEHTPMENSDDEEKGKQEDADGKIPSNSFSVDAIQPTEGNETRDLWKIASHKYCEKDSLNIYEKASLGAFCGNLKSLLRVAENWEDYLWAYLRVLIDIRVESEIRDNIIKEYRPLEDEYWAQRISLNEVFERLEVAGNSKVRSEAQTEVRIVQMYIILDDIPKLTEIISKWLDSSHLGAHFLRFLSHLLLFFEQIGQINNRDITEKVLESYIACLAEMNETRLVAFYVSKLGVTRQVEVYATYLERILEYAERKEALSFADASGLKVEVVAKQVVQNIRSRPHEVDEFGDLQQKLTNNDLLKVSAIEWLLIYNSTKVDAVEQCNALIFTFLTLKNLDAAQLAFNKIPSTLVNEILSEGELDSNINQIIKEHLSYKAYLDAQEAFSEWYKQCKSKPISPGEISENAHFTEKVAHQHRESQFKADTERWKLTTSHAAKTAKCKLYNVLLFPEGGWLSGAKDCEFLRSTCIPEMVVLLCSVLKESNNYEESVQLADVVASEKYGLYKEFSKDKLKEFVRELCDSSVALLNNKKDAWGNYLTV